MKRYLIVGVVIVVLLGGALGGVMWRLRLQRPDVLMDRLLTGPADEIEEVQMRLNLARGDVAGAMIEGFRREGIPPERRALLTEMMFSHYARLKDEKLAEALRAAVRDRDAQVRRTLVYNIAVHSLFQDELPALANDGDREVRRQAYMILAGPGGWYGLRSFADQGLWAEMTEEQRNALLARSAQVVQESDDEEMKHLARSVIGRRIEILCSAAFDARQRNELQEAEKLLNEALALDPEHHQARVRMVRYLLGVGDEETALAKGRELGVLIEAPLLKEAPVIDGDPTDAAWQQAYAGKQFYITTERWAPRPSTGRTEVFVAHRDGKLYLAYVGYEENLTRLKRDYTKHDSDVFRDDCIEVIIDPLRTGEHFYQIVINNVGAVLDLADHNRAPNFEFEHAVKVFPDRGYWACEIALPGESLQTKDLGGVGTATGSHRVAQGELWGINLFRGRISADEQCCLWSTFGGAHRMDLYPLILFLGENGATTRLPATQPATQPAAHTQPSGGTGDSQ